MNKVINEYAGSFCLKSITATISNYVVQVCRSRISVFAALLAFLLVAGSASGQQITTRTTPGTYSVVCDGYLTFPNPFPPTSNPPSFQFAPAKLLGTRNLLFRKKSCANSQMETTLLRGDVEQNLRAITTDQTSWQ
jgi:hypothetical protein